MEDPKWLRLITIGLVLAAVAIGYFLFTGRFSNTAQKAKNEISQNTPSPFPSVSPSESVSPKPIQNQTGAAQISSSSPAPASGRVVERSGGALNGNIQSLPRTAFPAGAGVIFSLVAIVTGWGLRKFPK